MIVFLPDAPTPVPARPPSQVAASPRELATPDALLIDAHWTRRPARGEWIISPHADEDHESEHDRAHQSPPPPRPRRHGQTPSNPNAGIARMAGWRDMPQVRGSLFTTAPPSGSNRGPADSKRTGCLCAHDVARNESVCRAPCRIGGSPLGLGPTVSLVDVAADR